MAVAEYETVECHCIEVYSQFFSSRLKDSWSEVYWDSDFTIVDPLPSDFETLHENTKWSSLLREATNVCREWIDLTRNEAQQNDRGFWVPLVENEINVKKIISICFYFMDNGQKDKSSFKEKEMASWSADLYCTLLSVPGSNAFSIFHPVVFQKSLDVCKILIKLNTTSRKRQHRHKKSNHNDKRRKKTKNDVNCNAGCLVDFFADDDEDEEGNSDDDDAMDPYNVKVLSATIEIVVRHIIDSLKTYSLKKCEQSCFHAIQRMTDLTRFENEVIVKNNSVATGQMSFHKLGYEGLKMLCTPIHGKVDKIHTQIMRHMMPSILQPQSRNPVKDKAIDFVLYLLSAIGDDALVGTRILIQHLCVAAMDKADYRVKVENSVSLILSKLPEAAFISIIKWLEKLVFNAKVHCRMFAIELIALIVLENGDKFSSENFSREDLLSLIAARCKDKASSVRGKALQILSSCANSNNRRLKNAFLQLFEAREAHEDSDKENDNETKDCSGEVPTPVTAHNENGDDSVSDEESEMDSPTSTKDLMQVLRCRCQDDKVLVRRAALQVLENLVKLSATQMTEQNLFLFEQHCLDPALMVRKQVINSISALLETYPMNAVLHRIVVEGVFPCVVDRETSIQEKCMEVMENALLQNIVAYDKSTRACHEMVWKILQLIADEGSIRYLRKVCNLWAKSGKISSKVILILQTHIHTKNDITVWLLLAEMSQFVPMKNVSIAIDYCLQRSDRGTTTVQQRVLTVIGNSAKYIARDKAEQLRDELEIVLKQFTYPISLITTVMNTLTQLYNHLSSEKERDMFISGFCVGLLKQCDNYLSDVILQQNSGSFADNEEEKIICYLFTLGEAAFHCPNRVPKRTFVLVQSLIASPVINSQDPTAYDSQPTRPPSSQLCSQPLSQFNGCVMSAKIRAHAFVTLGKLCLQNEALAKKCAPALARELEVSTDAVIRNNVVVIMADLCVRYTALVDRYISSISACLKDDSVIVRRQTLMLLTNLLQEDYIKWKGALFFRFICSLMDENSKIRSLTEYALIHVLHHRYPNMFYNHFVECIFHFNAYKDHAAFKSVCQSEKEVRLFSLRGQGQNEEYRHAMYCFMLDNMTDEQRFQITAKIVHDILGAVVDGVLPLNEHSQDIIRDGLKILVCEEIKLTTIRASPQDELDEGDIAAAVVVTAKKTIITQVLKKNVIENIVPIIISLKHKLEENRSHLLRDLMLFLKELMKDYKNEIKDILAADKGLAKEIEFDLRRFENEQHEERRINRRRQSVIAKPGPDAKENSLVNSPSNTFSPRNVLLSAKRVLNVDLSSAKTSASEASAKGTPTPSATIKETTNTPTLRKEKTPVVNARTSKEGPRTQTTPSSANTICQSPQNVVITPVVVLQRLSPEMSSPTVNLSPKFLNLSIKSPSKAKASPLRTAKTTSQDIASPLRELRPMNLRRAISTPQEPMDNITFRNDNSLSLAPSPIARSHRKRHNKRKII